MYITQETDYAARIVFSLAKAENRKDAKTISEETGVTLRFSLKILHKLVQNGIVKSYKGTKGGYEIAKEPSEISLLDIMQTTQGESKMFKCEDGTYTCSNKNHGICRLQKEFTNISKETNQKLRDLTFDKLI